jgi:hypothetical protein
MERPSRQTESPSTTQPRPATANRASHFVILITCASILLAASLLETAGDFIKVGPWTLPSVCSFRLMTGIPCPGCGLTRSIVAAVHGDWVASYAYNRMGPVVLVYLLLQTACRITWLSVERFRAAAARAGRLLDWALIPLLVLVLLNWIPTLLGVLRITG